MAHVLRRLEGVEDVRIVTGFGESEVMDCVKALRRDVIFVRNPAFRSTSTLTSYVLGAEHLKDPCLFMDADIWFEPESFAHFLQHCESKHPPLIAVTAVKTQDAVYAHLDEQGSITQFSRTEIAPQEWANLAFLPANFLRDGATAVFEQLAASCPLQALNIASYEIDTPEDLLMATERYQALHQQAL
jgi:choline kinase